MRTIFEIITLALALTLALTLAFATPALAEIECKKYDPQPVDPAMIEFVTGEHPNITSDDHIWELARFYQAIMQAEENGNSELLSAQHRALEQRRAALLTKMLALQILAAEKLPKFVEVLGKMEAEEEEGLIKVSTELLPEVRHSASAIVVIGEGFIDVASDMNQILVDRFNLDAQNMSVTEASNAVEKILCAFQETLDLLEIVVDYLPNAIMMLRVKRLYY